uniref:Peptidase_M1 domain-containing protein n=2 Tax=Bursaphelenchus xylophilus TaxID=6326 RepID=A0A1I7SKG1_BURXY
MPTLAMQNFGLITYSNSFGVTSDLEIKEELEQRRLVCHETAHQWFSNIITTNDWGQIFLHEGFATYFEDIVFKTSTNDEKIALETKRVQNFQEGIQEKLFNGHPIISKKFVSDETVYLSAGAVIQMVENVIGREKFRNSIQILIEEHFLGNFDYNDVINAFEKVRKSSKKVVFFDTNEVIAYLRAKE